MRTRSCGVANIANIANIHPHGDKSSFLDFEGFMPKLEISLLKPEISLVSNLVITELI